MRDTGGACEGEAGGCDGAHFSGKLKELNDALEKAKKDLDIAKKLPDNAEKIKKLAEKLTGIAENVKKFTDNSAVNGGVSLIDDSSGVIRGNDDKNNFYAQANQTMYTYKGIEQMNADSAIGMNSIVCLAKFANDAEQMVGGGSWEAAGLWSTVSEMGEKIEKTWSGIANYFSGTPSTPSTPSTPEPKK